jgi:hypothetical protein
MRIGRGDRSTTRKPSPVSLHSPRIPFDLTLDRTWACAVGKLVTSIPELWPNFVSGTPPRRPNFSPRLGLMGFVVDEVAMGHVFYEYFTFPCHLFHRQLHTLHPSSIGET